MESCQITKTEPREKQFQFIENMSTTTSKSYFFAQKQYQQSHDEYIKHECFNLHNVHLLLCHMCKKRINSWYFTLKNLKHNVWIYYVFLRTKASAPDNVPKCAFNILFHKTILRQKSHSSNRCKRSWIKRVLTDGGKNRCSLLSTVRKRLQRYKRYSFMTKRKSHKKGELRAINCF